MITQMKYNAGNFVHGTPPRIMGSETEYTTGTKSESESASFFANIDPSKILTPSSPENNKSLWLKNGAHIYQDAGYVHEYASPECMSATELLHYEKAGEEIIQAAATAALTTPFDRVYKRAGYADVYGKNGAQILEQMSTGHHENYYFPFTNLLTRGLLAQQELDSYLSTRAIWSGTGLVGEHGFDISQKASAVNFRGNSSTDDGDKIAYKMHDESARLEIRTGEGNMSEWVIVQKFAMTSLVLRLIEHGRFPPHLLLPSDPTYAMRSMSRYPAAAILGLEHISAANHQKMIAEHALDFAEHQPSIPAEEIHATEEIIRACRQIDDYLLRSGDIANISDRIDWAAKYHRMIEKGFTEFDITTENLEAVMHDISWENISVRGISRLWYKRKKGLIIAKPEDIEYASYVPPETRAKERVQAIKNTSKQRRLNYVTWNIVDTDRGMLKLPSPYGNQLNEPQ
jgi:hypothetical protein